MLGILLTPIGCMMVVVSFIWLVVRKNRERRDAKENESAYRTAHVFLPPVLLMWLGMFLQLVGDLLIGSDPAVMALCLLATTAFFTKIVWDDRTGR